MTFNRDRKNFKKIIILSVFSLIMSSGSFFQISADEVDSPSVEYINASQYTSTDSVDGVSNGNDKDVENISIKPLEFTPTKIRSYSKREGVNDSKFDPREKGYMTGVRDQESLGICWTFAGNATLETFLKLKGYGDFDLSEEHMRWWAKENVYGWNIGDTQGSTNETSIGYFTSWLGPKLEKDIPYNGRVTRENGAKKPANYDSASRLPYNVTGVINVAADKTSVKNAILKYGAVMSGYYDDKKCLSSDSNSYYLNEKLGQNHAITIVGWDDNYSVDKFNGAAKPGSKGAWLVKNSWGDYNSEHGYMWISYEDKNILSYTDNYSITEVKEDKGQKIYQHEYSMTASLADNTLTTANVFEFGKHEALQGVMFASDSIGAKYEIYLIPINGNEAINYNNRILLKTGTVPYSGYITEEISNFPLATGKGAIAVRIDNRANNRKSKIAMEMNVKGYDMFRAKANLGQSYVLRGGTFIDLNKMSGYAPANLVIKGITKSYQGGKSLAGQNRYDTAVKVSSDGWTESDTVFLVNGKAIADALTATPLARLKSAPILLTEKDQLNDLTSREINRLKAKNIVIIGGKNSISKDLEDKLVASGKQVQRISGDDRKDTSKKIAEEVLKIKKVDTISLVNGYKGLADAISFSPVAGEKTIPIILTDNKGLYSMPEDLKDTSKVSKSYIIGGFESVPRSVASNLSSPERVSGINRSDTNAQIIEKFYPAGKLDYVFVSKNGQKNPDELIDGLAVGAYAAKVSSPIVLANGKLSDNQVKALEKKKITNITQVGLGPNSMAVTELLIMQAGSHTDLDTNSIKSDGSQLDNSKIDSLEVDSKTVKNTEQ
ncbi:cell wall-binding repeat-containing protein [Peptostreptococcus sp.]|uniref:cell wall-binding repeat-containing protein n=1 Tax=Peptostreptococcus sp. TaxID=1262 RepID=UPI001CACEAD7|nr:cell wall-binding repeat-containing protein [Peptostreptococcus sp.]MBF1050420.1 cell wall-binding repeat-containing protein [Peptostreptococcus sp.]